MVCTPHAARTTLSHSALAQPAAEIRPGYHHLNLERLVVSHVSDRLEMELTTWTLSAATSCVCVCVILAPWLHLEVSRL